MQKSLEQSELASPILVQWVKEKNEQISNCEEQLLEFLKEWKKE